MKWCVSFFIFGAFMAFGLWLADNYANHVDLTLPQFGGH